MALGGKESGEPLNSEDMALLEAVAAQVATAFENGRLYHQLQLKAAELDRERALQRERHRVARRRPAGRRPRRARRALEPVARAALRPAAAPRRSAGASTSCSTASCSAPCARTASTAAAGQPSNVSVLYRVADRVAPRRRRAPRLVNVAEAPLRDVDGRTAGTIVILEDITSRVQLEEQLQISEKMASIGLLAAGVAHEVNTPLTGISSFTQLLLEGADPDDPRTKLLEKIERQTFRAAKIVNGLLNLSRPAADRRRPGRPARR